MEQHRDHSQSLTPDALQRLVDHRNRFLGFLEKRVGSRAVAEDLLQSAFVRGLEKGDSLQADSSVVAWFYRILRNAVIDHYRRQSSSSRSMEAFVREVQTFEQPDLDMKREICGCVAVLLEDLRPEYRQALQAVDLEEASLASFAAMAGITEGNAGVRVHRARESLRKQVRASCGVCAEHGCIDCRCKPQASPAETKAQGYS